VCKWRPDDGFKDGLPIASRWSSDDQRLRSGRAHPTCDNHEKVRDILYHFGSRPRPNPSSSRTPRPWYAGGPGPSPQAGQAQASGRSGWAGSSGRAEDQTADTAEIGGPPGPGTDRYGDWSATAVRGFLAGCQSGRRIGRAAAGLMPSQARLSLTSSTYLQFQFTNRLETVIFGDLAAQCARCG